MKKYIVLFTLCLIIPFCGFAVNEYTGNIRDHKVLQKSQKQLDRFVQQGEKEMLIYILGRIYLGIKTNKDTQSKFILTKLQEQTEQAYNQVITQKISLTTFSTGTQSTGDSQKIYTTTGEKVYGKASYYASSLEGNNTANGEKYSNSLFTAAHKTLPFGTRIKVSNEKNNSRVVVRINDRGPYIPGRIIDLSQAAFKALANDSLNAGILDISLEIVVE